MLYLPLQQCRWIRLRARKCAQLTSLYNFVCIKFKAPLTILKYHPTTRASVHLDCSVLHATRNFLITPISEYMIWTQRVEAVFFCHVTLNQPYFKETQGYPWIYLFSASNLHFLPVSPPSCNPTSFHSKWEGRPSPRLFNENVSS